MSRTHSNSIDFSDDEEWSLVAATVAAGVMIATPQRVPLSRSTSGSSEGDGDGVLVDVTPLGSPRAKTAAAPAVAVAAVAAATPPSSEAKTTTDKKDDTTASEEKKGLGNTQTLYILGGQTVPSPTIPTCTAGASRLIGGRLETLTSLPHGAPRFRHSSTRVGEYIYIIGGHTTFQPTPPLSSVERLHLPTMKWSTVAPLPRPRCDHVSVAVGHEIFVMGGSPSSESTSMIIYDTEKNTWRDGEEMIIPRSMHCCAAVEKKIFVFGGYAVPKKGRPAPVPATHLLTGATTPAGTASSGSLNESVPCEVYDQETGLWTEIGSMPSTSYRFHAATVAIDDKILLLGGSAPIAASDAVLEYTPASDTWRQLAWKLPAPRSGFAAWYETATRSLYIAGGQPWSKCSNVWVRSLETGAWNKVADLPACSEFGSCA